MDPIVGQLLMTGIAEAFKLIGVFFANRKSPMEAATEIVNEAGGIAAAAGRSNLLPEDLEKAVARIQARNLNQLKKQRPEIDDFLKETDPGFGIPIS